MAATSSIYAAVVGLMLVTLWLAFLTYYAITATETAIAGANGPGSLGSLAGGSGSSGDSSDNAQIKMLQKQLEILNRREKRKTGSSGDASSSGGSSKEDEELMVRIRELKLEVAKGAKDAREATTKLAELQKELDACKLKQKAAAKLPNHAVDGPKADEPDPEDQADTPKPKRKKNVAKKKKRSDDDDEEENNDDPAHRKAGVLSSRKKRHVEEADPDFQPPLNDPGVPDVPYDTDPPEPPSVGIDVSKVHDNDGYTIPIIVFAYNRPDMLKRCIKTIFSRIPQRGFHVYISQDGRQFPEVTRAIQHLVQTHKGQITHLTHRRDVGGSTQMDRQIMGWQSYYAIAHHYKFAINEIFKVPHYDRLILLEEDIEVGVDFFQYMNATSYLFDEDDTLYCVSAWNDNGKRHLIGDPQQLYRTDFFPGLGWMTSRTVWNTLKKSWPNGFWDDWMRQPKNRRGRTCIRPEVPRTFTWCNDEGASQGQFCAEHLQEIFLNDKPVDWRSVDLDYLHKDNYDTWLDDVLSKASEVKTAEAVVRTKPTSKEVKLYYNSKNAFSLLAKQFELMDDFKENVPRTAYRGVVTFRHQISKNRVHLVSKEEMY